MDDEVDRWPFLRQRREGRIQCRHVRHVAVEQAGDAELFGERAYALFHRGALIGKGKFRALLRQLLGNAPGQRLVVGEAHDQPPLACHQTRHALITLSCGRGLL